MSIIKNHTDGIRRAKPEPAYSCAVLINVHNMSLPPAVRRLKQLKAERINVRGVEGKGAHPPNRLDALEKTMPTSLISNCNYRVSEIPIPSGTW